MCSKIHSNRRNVCCDYIISTQVHLCTLSTQVSTLRKESTDSCAERSMSCYPTRSNTNHYRISQLSRLFIVPNFIFHQILFKIGSHPSSIISLDQIQRFLLQPLSTTSNTKQHQLSPHPLLSIQCDSRSKISKVEIHLHH